MIKAKLPTDGFQLLAKKSDFVASQENAMFLDHCIELI